MAVRTMIDCTRCGHTVYTDVPEPRCSNCGKKAKSGPSEDAKFASRLATSTGKALRAGLNWPDAHAEGR
jgi:hypothetical protein